MAICPMRSKLKLSRVLNTSKSDVRLRSLGTENFIICTTRLMKGTGKELTEGKRHVYATEKVNIK